MWTVPSIGRWNQFTYSWANLLDSVIGILSFGWLWAGFGEHAARRQIKKRVKKYEKQGD